MKKQDLKANWKFETKQLHVGQEIPDTDTGSRAMPIYQTSSYVFKDCQSAADRFALKEAGNIYTRLTNPTQQALEERIASLENGIAALAVASGAAAIAYTIQALTHPGDHIVASQSLYGGTFNLFANTLPSYGVDTSFVNIHDFSEVEAAITPTTKLIFVETMGNPNADITNLDEIAKISHRHNIPLVVDNTFGAAYLIRPIEHGADIVIHSATKFIGGHGTSLGGLIVDSGKFNWKQSGKFPYLVDPNPSYHGISFTDIAGPAAFIVNVRAIILRDFGAAISPFNAFMLLQGLETLSLRVERHVKNALQVVAYLQNHPKVAKVNHPSLPERFDHELYNQYFPWGAGSIFTFEITGTAKDATEFIDKLQLFSLLANVADAKSLVIHPASTTHSQLTPEELDASGIKPTTIRLSIGLENIDDIIADLEQALA